MLQEVLLRVSSSEVTILTAQGREVRFVALSGIWSKSLDYIIIVRRFDQNLCARLTPHWKVLQS